MLTDEFFEILDLLPSGVMLADREGRVEYANRAARSYMRLSQEDCAGLNLKGLLRSKGGTKETILRTPEDRQVHVRLIMSDLTSGRCAAILTDITEIHDLQQEILKMDRLASVGELTSGIAHEIRNPLAGIKTTAQALNEELPVYDHKRAYVDRIIKEIDRLNKLVVNFFDFAKPKTLHMQECDLVKVLDDAVVMVREMASSSQVQVIELYPARPVKALADPDMIQQVLINILINGIQAMDAGGRLEVNLRETSSQVEMVVSDTGKGIPEHLRSRIFDPFFTTKPKGIGLGLSISYRIMRMHTGNITFSSGEEGTTFRVLLKKGIQEKEDMQEKQGRGGKP